MPWTWLPVVPKNAPIKMVGQGRVRRWVGLPPSGESASEALQGSPGCGGPKPAHQLLWWRLAAGLTSNRKWVRMNFDPSQQACEVGCSIGGKNENGVINTLVREVFISYWWGLRGLRNSLPEGYGGWEKTRGGESNRKYKGGIFYSV